MITTKSTSRHDSTKWLCCQLGAREHYAIPRALFRLSMLDQLVTDAWVPPSSSLAKLSGSRLADRFADELNAEMKDVLAYQSLDHLWEER